MIVRVNVVLNRTVVVKKVTYVLKIDYRTACQETSVTANNNNSPIQVYVHSNDHTQPTYEMTSGFKPFTDLKFILLLVMSDQNFVLSDQDGFLVGHNPIRVCAAQRRRDFEAPDLERGIHFRGVF